jgi:NAD(P)-dependent dehydrogenase (short-subunit alcohol dehydrogenase family)
MRPLEEETILVTGSSGGHGKRLGQELAARGATVLVISPRSSLEEGAVATLRLVSDPELDGVSGRFFDGVRQVGVDGQARDADARRRLWEVSEELSGTA